MTDAVAERVLRGSYTQTQSLSLARAQAPAMLDVHDRFMRELESAGRLDRALEALPDNDTVADRRTANQGLTQPELAVILAYSKITLYAALLESDLPEDPALGAELERYFPTPLPERFGDEMAAHRLRREIVATRVTNDLVDRAGTTFVFRLGEDTGAAPADIARASIVARDVFQVRALWRDIEALDGQVAADVQYDMLLASRRMVERSARWLLRTRPRPLDIAEEVSRYADGARVVGDLLPDVLVESEQESWRERVSRLTEQGVPEELAGARRGAGRAVLGARHRRGRRRDRARPRGGRAAALPARRQAAPALAARPDRAARARHALGGDGARGAARRPVLAARGADRRRAALRRRSTRGWRPTGRRSNARRRSSARSAPAARSTSRRCRSRCARCATSSSCAPPPLRGEAAPALSGNAPGSGPSWSSTRVTHLTQMKPRCPGATSRTGAPWPWLSGSSPTWVASRSLRGLARSKLQR